MSKARDVAQLVEFLPNMHKALGWISSTIQPGEMLHTYNPSTREAKAEMVHSEFKTSLSQMRSCLSKQTKTKQITFLSCL